MMRINYLYVLSLCYLLGLISCSHNHNGEGHDHDEANADHHDGILFTKEQAEHILDFKVETVKPQTFYEILKTSGQVLSAPGDEQLVSATMSGLISIPNPDLVEGLPVKSGQLLFSISGNNLSENNPNYRIIEARSVFENARKEYERAAQLIDEKIISEKDFLQVKLNYDQAKLNYETLSIGMSGSSKSITAGMTGFIKSMLVQSGQYVEVGQPLAMITQNKQLVLRADVSQRYLAQIKDVTTASFVTPYDNQVHDLSELNGYLVSFGRSSENSYYTPINFEFDNKGNIIEGSFVEVYLKSKPIENAIVVPVTALIEEQGHLFVFIQMDEHDDEYIKQEVKVGGSDAMYSRIIEGLKVGQKVVTSGAYAVKLASMSSAMPEHTH